MTTKELPLIGGQSVGGHPQGFGGTLRTDAWWAGPGITLVVFSTFVVYTTWALFQGEYYYAEPYLSPFYSPVLMTNLDAPGAAPLEHAWFGEWPAWWPDFALLPASPALLVLVFPLSFRMTCYYYRKAYYRAYAASPPGCAVSPGKRGRYKGETGLLIVQNIHRYALYFALIFIFILGYDALIAFFRDGELGFGVGSLILTVNVVLIACYTLGCHSFRHLIGGRDDCMSCGRQTLKYGAWRQASWLNGRHMEFAWASLLWVMLTDVYVRLVSMGVIEDWNTWS
jgi:hypothetical protein